jgi:hypothetical protein
MNTIGKRATKILNLKQFGKKNKAELVSKHFLETPTERQYVLRMLIKKPFTDFLIPDNLKWCEQLINDAYDNQLQNDIRQPFCYLTVRSGVVNTSKDDEWHADGFSMNVTHIPEQNYIWADCFPTEVIYKKFKIPADFNPFRHNIHLLFQDSIGQEDKIKVLKPNLLYCLDPYVIHRRPPISEGTQRTFVRVSFTPIEIDDINNTINPLLATNYTRDGLAYRNSLTRYGS